MSHLRSLLFAAAALSLSLGAVAIPAAHAAPAPAFELTGLDGARHKLSEYAGKVVLVNFWATWCGPCQVEMPHLQKMQTELLAKGFVVVGISSDDAKLDAMVKPAVKRLGLTYTILRDPQTTVVSQYNPSKTLPFNALVDRKGQLVKTYSGYNPGDEVKLRADVEALLAAQ